MKKILEKGDEIKTKAKESAIKFQRELKKSIATAIIAAFGLIIALTWKDVITEFVDKISQLSPIQGKLIGAVIVTIVATMGILITSKLTNEPKKD